MTCTGPRGGRAVTHAEGGARAEEAVAAGRARPRHGAVSAGGGRGGRRARGAPVRVPVRERELPSLREEPSAVTHGIAEWARTEGTAAIGRLGRPP